MPISSSRVWFFARYKGSGLCGLGSVSNTKPLGQAPRREVTGSFYCPGKSLGLLPLSTSTWFCCVFVVGQKIRTDFSVSSPRYSLVLLCSVSHNPSNLCRTTSDLLSCLRLPLRKPDLLCLTVTQQPGLSHFSSNLS